jgi:hypothetical protein
MPALHVLLEWVLTHPGKADELALDTCSEGLEKVFKLMASPDPASIEASELIIGLMEWQELFDYQELMYLMDMINECAKPNELMWYFWIKAWRLIKDETVFSFEGKDMSAVLVSELANDSVKEYKQMNLEYMIETSTTNRVCHEAFDNMP